MRAEREAQLIADQERGGHAEIKGAGYKAWLRASWIAIKENWVLFVYLVILMTGFNSCSHGRLVSVPVP
jgi:SHS family lactate transporter-like MFS transporter